MSPICSHTGAQPSTPVLICLVDDMLLQARSSTMQQSSAASDHQHPVLAYGRHTPAWPWLTGLYSQLDYSVATGLGQWSAVSRIFDAVLYAIKIVVSFYKVQHEHITLRCDVLCTCVCFLFPWVCFCQELAKLDDIWLCHHKYKKGWRFFSETQCTYVHIMDNCVNKQIIKK